MARTKAPSPARDAIENLSAGKQHLLALSILFALPVLLFWSTVLGDRQFMGHDTIQWRAGAESVFDYRADHDGEEPLWAENMFGGMPAYTVHVFKSVPHLDNLVFDRLRVIWPAVPYWVLLGGTYFLFVLMGFSPLVSALGAILFGFTTYMPIIIGAGHNIKFIAYSWIPWMLSGYWLMTRGDRRWWGFLLFAIAATLHFRAGHPQVTYYFVYLFAFLYIFDSWNLCRKGLTKQWAGMTGLMAGALLLALLGTAEQYLRLMEYSPHSIRGGSAIADIAREGGLSIEYAFSWSQGILETLTLLIPNLFGGSSGMAYWGEKPGTSGPHYLGAVAFLLFLTGLLRSRRKVRHVFLAAGLLTMTFSWGHHFFLNDFWFRVLPGFDKFRTPEMWLTVTVFAFTVIALFGLEAIWRMSAEKRAAAKFYLPAGIAAGIGLVLLAGSTLLLPFESGRERAMIAQQLAVQSELPPDNPQVQRRAAQIIETQLKPERRALARNDTLRYLLITGASAALILWFLQAKLGGGMLMLSLILIASFDMLAVGSRYIGDASLVERELELTQVIESLQSPADRYLSERVQEPEGWSWRVLPLDDNPFNNAIPSYSYPSIGGYSGAKLSLIQDIIDEGLFTGPEGINRPVLNMLNVRYITARRQLPLQGFREVHAEDDYHVYENLNVLPRAWFVDEVITAASPREAFSLILPQQEFDPVRTAVVEHFGEFEIGADEQAEVEIVRHTARRIELETRRSEPGFLVLSEIYYPPGWEARLNGEVIPVHKTNYLLRGFEIPAGNHRLELEFHPASHIAGSAISWAANGTQWLIGILLLAFWLKRRRESSTNGPP